MKRLLAISLSLAMVFAIFGAMTVSVSAETVTQIDTLTSDDITFTAMRYTNGVFTADKTDPDTLINVTMNGNPSDKSFTIKSDKLVNSDKHKITKIEIDLSSTRTVTTYFTYSTDAWQQNAPTGIQVVTSNLNSVVTLTVPESSRSNNYTCLWFGLKTMSAGDVIKIKSIKVTYETTAYADPTIEMASGAAMRIDGTTNGIRFEASVDKSAFVAIKDKTKIEIGTLIAKEGTEKSKVVVENATEVTSSGQNIGNKIPVAKYASTTTMADIEGTDKYVIYGSLVGIDDGNATQKYVARAYVKYTDESGEHVLYAKDLSEPRSLAEVAYKLKNDTAVPEGMSGTYYNSLCQTHKDYVDGLAKQYVE